MSDRLPIKFDLPKFIDWDDWQHECLPRLAYAAGLKIPHLPRLEPHHGACIVVGAAPSVKDNIDKIKGFAAGEDNLVLTVNGAHNWLIQQGVTPNLHVISEMDLDDVTVALGGKPHGSVVYYIASYCASTIFQQLATYQQVLWHPFCEPEGYQTGIGQFFPGEFMVGGGFCTFFRCITIPIILGYREFELFGVDSSFEGSSHIDGYVLADKEAQVTLWGADPTHTEMRRFVTNGSLAWQANSFLEFCKDHQAGLRMRIHGEGLLRFIHETRYPEQYLT